MSIIFQEHPHVHLGGNTFINVPIILQVEDLPLIEVVDHENAGYSTKFDVYHNDGTHLAVVKGARMHLREEGKKANLNLLLTRYTLK